MNINIGLLQLHSALKTVRLHWDEVKMVWSDSVRKDFEENHWDPLLGQTKSTQRAMEHLAQIVGTLKQDCS